MEHAETPVEGSGYPGLVERARACILEHRGALEEDKLVSLVFGATSSPTLWRPLLRTLLQKQPDIVLRPDGVWAMGTQSPALSLPGDFVVLDVETTGLKPSQQRVIEVAIIRVSSSGAPLRWSSLINPGRRLPDYIATLTGIDDMTLAGEPDFRSLAPTIVEMLDDLPIVAHNAAFDVAFINAELMRCGLPRLINATIDTLSLADQLAPDARRLNLQDVARALGVVPTKAHRAMSDVETTLAVFLALGERARARGQKDLTALLEAPKVRRHGQGRGRPPAARGHAVLSRDHLVGIPHAPGVYIMRDAEERVLYVGKALDLRKRVSSYYSQPLGYTRKLDGLLESIDRIECVVVGSELEALLLESQLIRRYRPRFNTQQRNVEQYVYVKLDVTNPWPRITTTRDRADDGARYFGPFKSAGHAKDAVELVNDILPLRTCRRSFADHRSYGSPCIELSLKRCAGPCMGLADPDVYRDQVQMVLRFFEGDPVPLNELLQLRLRKSVARNDFERAARLRDRMRRAESIARQQWKIEEASRHAHALLVMPDVTPDSRSLWYLLRGRRWAQLQLPTHVGGGDGDADDLRERLDAVILRARRAEHRFEPDHHAVDELAILARWLRKTPNHPALLPLRGDEEPSDLLAWAHAVDLSVPFGVGAGADDDVETEDGAPDVDGAGGAGVARASLSASPDADGATDAQASPDA